MKIAEKKIGLNSAPFVIAEMSGNHNQSLERALEIVDAAAEAGVHALKIQTYTADTMTLDIQEGDFFIDDPIINLFFIIIIRCIIITSNPNHYHL